MAAPQRLADRPEARRAARKARDHAFQLKMIREALADYMESEGCGCCRNIEDHKLAARRLGNLLKVPKYADGSGHDFSKYRSQSNQGDEHGN